MPEDSVTYWIQRALEGDEDASRILWERYFHQLVTVARKKLRDSQRRVTDEEDVALSAFDSFFQRAQEGGFPSLNDRADLWKLLVTITARKAIDYQKHENRKCRGGGRVASESALDGPDRDFRGIEYIADEEPTPEFAAILVDEFECLMNKLGEEWTRQIAQMKLEGYLNAEIAERVGCCTKTVERKLELIRSELMELQTMDD